MNCTLARFAEDSPSPRAIPSTPRRPPSRPRAALATPSFPSWPGLASRARVTFFSFAPPPPPLANFARVLGLQMQVGEDDNEEEDDNEDHDETTSSPFNHRRGHRRGGALFDTHVRRASARKSAGKGGGAPGADCRRNGGFDAFYASALGSGAALIIGANVGPTATDFAWIHLKESRFTKVFLEPVPPLFAQLQSNLRESGVTNFAAINAAISAEAGQSSAKLDMWCVGTPGEKVRLRGNVVPWLSQVCTTTRDRLFSGYDLLKMADAEEVDSLITHIEVPMVNFQQMLAMSKVAPETVAYVQIDVEGIDDKIVLSLPLDDPTFKPRVIMWEHVLFSEAIVSEVNGFLKHHGYNKFCILGQNVVAFKDDKMTGITHQQPATGGVRVISDLRHNKVWSPAGFDCE